MKLVLILALLLASCGKQKYAHCYTCTFGYTNGSPSPARPPLDTCSDVTSDHYQFTDSRGNDIGFWCQEK